MEQIDGHENEDGFIIRLYNNPPSVWVYWPGMSKVEYYLATLEEAKTLYEALKPLKVKPVDRLSREQ